MTYIEVTPAYGRDYTNKNQVRADWNKDLDFQETTTRSYINKSGAERLGLRVIVRYGKLRKVMDMSQK